MKEKVYVDWAYSENQNEKQRINIEIYERLKENVLWLGNLRLKGISEKDLEVLKKTKVIMKYCGQDNFNHYVRVISNPYNFSNDELALIADEGNLCFGYRGDSNYLIIYKD